MDTMNKEEKINVLLVDDRPENLLSLESILEDQQLGIFKATSGKEALGMLLKRDFALVILDVQMPEMDGFETAELMRGIHRTKYIPIIFVTAISKEDKHIFKGYESGGVDYMFKPIETDILKTKVNMFVELYRQRKEIARQKDEISVQRDKLEETNKQLKEAQKKVEEANLQLEKANKKLEKLATIDGLTEIANHRKFVEFFDREWRRSVRNKKPISVILIDVDFFKLYNDTYGHQIGDECLKRISQAIDDTVNRPTDLVARYGGEEFIIVLSETDSSGTLHVAKSVRLKVENLKIDHKTSKVSECVTISLGCATTIAKNEDESELLIAAADDALYKSKREGRNRISVASPSFFRSEKERRNHRDLQVN